VKQGACRDLIASFSATATEVTGIALGAETRVDSIGLVAAGVGACLLHVGVCYGLCLS
jgi:hypothetical protein